MKVRLCQYHASVHYSEFEDLLCITSVMLTPLRRGQEDSLVILVDLDVDDPRGAWVYLVVDVLVLSPVPLAHAYEMPEHLQRLQLLTPAGRIAYGTFDTSLHRNFEFFEELT